MEKQKADLRILFEDRELLVCRKPAGVPVQSASLGTKDLVSMLRTYLAGAEPGKGIPYVGVVHRLDQPVEGVMVFAKTRKSAAHLSAQAADGRMEKTYHAVVLGEPPAKGRLTDWLLKDGRGNTSRIVPPGTAGAKKAELTYRTLEKREGKTLVEIHLETGRHHQIRVQFVGRGTPLYGDRKYADACSRGDAFGTVRQEAGRRPEGGTPGTVALCAVRLSFLHPGSGKRMTFSCAPLGDGFCDFVQDRTKLC